MYSVKQRNAALRRVESSALDDRAKARVLKVVQHYDYSKVSDNTWVCTSPDNKPYTIQETDYGLRCNCQDSGFRNGGCTVQGACKHVVGLHCLEGWSF
jgi:hypothetical protein